MGFMWITCNDAINRYDGKMVKVYNLNRDFSNCPNLQQGYGLTEDAESNIYIGSTRGLYIYHRSQDRFTLQKIFINAPENMAAYPEFSMFGELPAWGMYVRHVKGLTMKNITLKMQQPDYRVATIFDDVNGLDLNNIKIVAPISAPIIVLDKVEKYTAKELQLPVDGKDAIKIIE